jgi:uncharacterized repeat protein (TIGR01451 family)
VYAQATTADLAVVQQATPEPVLPGETITFTVKIVNQGPLPAANIVVTDDLPSEVLLVSMSVWTEVGPTAEAPVAAASLSVATYPGAGQPADEIGGGRIIVPIGSLESGSVAMLQMVTRVKPSLSRGWHLVNQASASAPQPDHDASNNASSLSVLIGPLPPAIRPRLFMPLILHSASSPVSCTEAAMNGGFEQDAGWTFPITGSTAGYTTAQVYNGARSARMGLLPGMISISSHPDVPEQNVLGEVAPLGASYSSGYQTVSIPGDAKNATLTFWYRPGSEATSGASSARCC